MLSLAIGGALLMGFAASAFAANTMSPDEITSALQIIRRDADRIAAGQYHGKSLQAPAHQIGVQWYKVEPILAKNGGIIVEMRMANRAIATFDKTWKNNQKARGAAKDVSSTIADLIATRTENPRPTQAPPSAGPALGSPVPTSPGAPAASPSPAPAGSPQASARP